MKKSVRTILACVAMLSTVAISSCEKGQIKIGILQPVEHLALEQARLGFINQLADKGYKDGEKIKIFYQNANGVEADQNQLAKDLVAKCDYNLGIGTGATYSLYSAEKDKSTKPIVFTAVTDAVAGNLVESNEHPGGFVTGTSDASPVEAQVSLIKEVLPTAKKMGILYTESEVNSQVQAEQAKAQAIKEGLECVIATCTGTSDLSTVALDLCGNKGIDVLYVPTDNNVSANFETVKQFTNKYHVLSVVGEENMLPRGGHISLSVDYEVLGRRTADILIKIFNGTNPGDIPVTTMAVEDCQYKMNLASLTEAGIKMPSGVAAKFADVGA